VRARGVGPTIRKLASLRGAAFTQVAAAVSMGAAQQTRTTAVRSIQTVSIGRTVMRQRQGGKMRPHVASRPGDPPNTDTGALVRSIATEKKGKTGARVGTGIKYGLPLETGTKKMAARPWLGPADEKTDITAIAKTMIQNFMRGMLRK
jgi:hypothetical protein